MIPKPRTRTIRDVASHRRRTMHSGKDMPRLDEGSAYGMLLTKCTVLDLVAHSARWMGGADLTLATWSASVGAVEYLDRVKAIRSVVWLLDNSQTSRRRRVLDAARATGTVHLINSHAKVAVLLNDDSGIVLAGSSNATKSRGAEWMCIDVDREYALAVRETLLTLVL